MFSNPYFGILISFVVFNSAKAVNNKIHNGILRALFNPLLVSIIIIASFLYITGISYEDCNQGGSLITFFIGPATVALMVSLYDNLAILKKHMFAILSVIFIGTAVSMFLAVILGKIFNLKAQTLISILPQSVTTAIALGLSTEYGGVLAIATIGVVLRGITGIILAPMVVRVTNMSDPVAQGVAIGTTSHALGTSKALEMGKIQGAMSGLSIALAGVITVILMPLAVWVINLI